MHRFDNRPTWRDKILFHKILEDLHPARKQLYVDLMICASPLAHFADGKVMFAPGYTEPWKQQQISAAKALQRNPREGPYFLSMILHDSEAELLDDQIPSWVPRWNTFDKMSTRPVTLISTNEYHILSLTGWKYDTVTWVSSGLEFVDLQGDLEDWKPHLGEKNTLPIESVWLQRLDKTSVPPEEFIGAFSLTLARGRPASDDHVDDLLLYYKRL
ncbi:heterokaryon incompatibility (het-6OR allele) [Fusarium acutatum]|uniref:Heterokaryon incompatibility (Het-6OR allele) n=1 Tax=Fusarium acutatum TaxID=78861 RepID=A0A8H4NKL3_9HYPO|nr:heterokaryon incompatibility (het-6OR allele) [Fusarium acutatum]